MELTLTAATGRPGGSRPAGRLRASGRVPGVIYGLGRDPVSLTVEWSELRRVLSTDAGANALITLDVDGTRDLTIVKELQRDKVRREVLHVDFLRVDPDAEVLVEVPVVLEGEAKEVENMRGVVEQPLKTLPILARPADIPHQITIEISHLEVGLAVTVGDVTLPAGSRTELDEDTQIVAGVPTRFTVLAQKGLSGAEMDAAADAADAIGASGDLVEVALEDTDED